MKPTHFEPGDFQKFQEARHKLLTTIQEASTEFDDFMQSMKTIYQLENGDHIDPRTLEIIRR